jgi:UDP-N-acetylmuramoylalanine--D-glutamate ligase
LTDSFWFYHRRVCVVGLGKSGLAAAHLLKKLGARVSMSEKKRRAASGAWFAQIPPGVLMEWGGHKSLAQKWDLVVVSPGVPEPVWRPLERRGIAVWGELELAARVLNLSNRWPATCAAVTGTNGKTTTTALLGAIFRADGRKTVVAGNIGNPLSDCVDQVSPQTALALEISSYQLEAAPSFKPRAAAVLNVTPDHLGRHGTMENYARAKFDIFANQTGSDAACLNAEDAWCRRLANDVPSPIFWFGLKKLKAPGVYFEKGRLVSTIPGRSARFAPPRFLLGKHNIQNALAAAALAQCAGSSNAAIALAFASFRGVEHRLESVRIGEACILSMIPRPPMSIRPLWR